MNKMKFDVFWLFVCLIMGAGIVLFPSTAYLAAKNGLEIWWEIVFPSLLPFFIISELLLNLGFVAFLGVLLEPLMRPLFNLPGVSGFVVGISFLSGFPLCALLTAKLRSSGLCSREEGERLMSFTSNASPLFILGAVSVGMFQKPYLGPFLAIVHYSSNLICGYLLGLFSKKTTSSNKTRTGCCFNRAFAELYKASQLGQKGFGGLLGDAVKNTVSTLLVIGGFISFFAVFLSILKETGVFHFILRLLQPIAETFGLPISLLSALFNGFFEITVGLKEISSSPSGLFQKLLATEAVLAWNGLAVQAQIAGIIKGSDLRILRYLTTRFLQIFISLPLTYLVFIPFAQKTPLNLLLIFTVAILLIIGSYILILLMRKLIASASKSIIIIK